jgi:glycopeptide antibiotics resistance protein
VSFNHVFLSFKSHRILEVSNVRMKKRSRKHNRRTEVNLTYFNSFIFCLLSSITDLAHKLEDAKNEIRGMPFAFYFTILLSSSTPELEKQLSEGFHKFLNTEPPTGMCFFLCFLHLLI